MVYIHIKGGICLLILLWMHPTLYATTCVEVLRAFVGDLDYGVFHPSYIPIQHPPNVSFRKIRAEALDAMDTLDDYGIRYEVANERTYLHRYINDPEFLEEARLFKIKNVTGAKSKRSSTIDADTPALLHPDLPKRLKVLKKYGYSLYVDSTLPLLNTGAYVSPLRKRLAISINSDWSEFEHEFGHVLFEETIVQPFIAKLPFKLRRMLEKGKVLNDSEVKGIPVDILNMINNGMPLNAIDEALAVARQTKILMGDGWSRLSREVIVGKLYALRHLISDLQGQRSLNKMQKNTLKKAIIKYFILERLAEFDKLSTAKKVAISFVGMPIAFNSLVILVARNYNKKSDDSEEDYLVIEKDEKNKLNVTSFSQKEIGNQVIGARSMLLD